MTTIAEDIVSGVPDACAELMEAEWIIMNCLKQPGPTPAGLVEARDACAAQIAKLGKRLRGES